MAEPTRTDGREGSRTGDDEVDAALAAVADLDEAPLAEHEPRLTQAHDTLRRVLERDPGSAAT